MGVMAAGAGFAFHRIAAMRFFERTARLVMTAQTEGRFSLGQQMALVRAVGNMASLASLFTQHRMNDLLFKHIFFMAAVADFITCCHQHGWGLGTMGVMALRAFAPLERCMYIFTSQSYLGRSMAIQADLVAVFLEQQLGNPPVAEMTVLALLLSDNRVQILLGEILCFKFCVTVQTFFADHFFWGGVTVKRDPRNNAATDKQHDERGNPDSYVFQRVHGFSC